MNDVMRMDWRGWATTPLARMLALSLSLHLALIMLIQPAPGSAQPRALVINARLLELPRAEAPTLQPEALPSLVEPIAEPVATDIPPEQPPPAKLEPPPILTVPEPRETTPPPMQVSESVVTPAPIAAPLPLPSPVPMPTADPLAASRSAEGPDATLPRVPVMHDTRWYTALEVDVHPKELPGQGPDFDYPEDARERGIEGTAMVMLKVDEFGRIQALEVLSANPPGVFEGSVRKGFDKAAFSPALRNGVPVRALMRIRVRFELD